MVKQPSFVYFEDDPMSCKVMELLLTRQAGYIDLTIFSESAQPIQKLEALRHKPDIVFMDIHMKPLNGFQVLELLRGHKSFRDLRVVALTASVMNEEVDLLKEAGFDGAIAKPIDPSTFVEIIDCILSGQEVWNII